MTALGAGLMAVPFASWTVEWIVGFVGHINVPVAVPSVAHWIPAILVGCALGMVRPSSCAAGRGVGREPCPVWLVPALFVSVNYVLRIVYWLATCRRCC